MNSKNTRDLDREVLTQLSKSGSDLKKLHNIEFFLYFKNKADADTVGEKLLAENFNIDVHQTSDSSEWICFATKSMIPDYETMVNMRTKLELLSNKYGGDYDGWGTSIEN